MSGSWIDGAEGLEQPIVSAVTHSEYEVVFDLSGLPDRPGIAAAMTGGLGLAPSASLSDEGPGIFEPVHGSAPDIAGRGIANPTGMLRSTALMLEHGLGRPDEAAALALAVESALATTPTQDLGGQATTAEFSDAVVGALERS